MKRKAIALSLVVVCLLSGAIVITGLMSDGIEAKGTQANELEYGIELVHQWGWGKIPKQNLCPHCGEFSGTRFCSNCKKERGNLPFIGVYCAKCRPDGRYASKLKDVTKICTDCGGEQTWKYVYEDWQVKPVIKREVDDCTIVIDANDYDWTCEAPTLFSDLYGGKHIEMDVSGDELVITGDTEDMNEAAEVFFDAYLKPMVDNYIKARLNEMAN